MKATKRLTFGIGVALALGMLAAGCGQQSSNNEPQNIGVVEAELVTTVELSPTHTLKFWDYGDGLTRIEENYDLDLDANSPLTLEKVDVRGHSLSSVYARFAGDQANPAAAAKIAQLDARAERLSKLNAASPELSSVQDSVPESGPAPLTPTTLPKSDLGVRQEAVTACAEPPNDWAADIGWFKTNYCGNDSWWCATNVGWADTGWSVYLTWYRSSGCNLSFCTTASYKVKYRSTAGGSGGIVEGSLINMTLPVRWVNDNAWSTPSGGHIRYWSRVQSTLDNPVTLAIHRTEL
jgi:hypothetical protein